MQDAAVDIAMENVSLGFEGRQVLEDVSLQLPRGAKCALSGESGAGKTTLLRVLLGAVRPRSGSVAICGLELTPKNLPPIRSRLFYLPQEIRANGDETVSDHLTAPFSLRANRGLRYERDRAAELLRRLRLADGLLDHRLRDLSGGERRRVGLARGLLLNRPVLLLDEATASVDAESRACIVDILLADPERTVLAVTHDRDFVARATQRAELVRGRLITR